MATELDPQHSPPTTSLKRRQSSVSEQDPKRPRATSPGKKTSPDPEATRASDAPSEDSPRREPTDQVAEAQPAPQEGPRRKSSAINEKDRSRRLFGGLLGSLSQKGDSRTAKRRQEIESRRKAELQRQDDEHVEDKQRRLEQLAEKRKRVRKEIEAETMRNRHRNMLHSAHFLHTEAQPRLLYKPWELRDEEEDRIDDQISEAKAQIERELAASNENTASHHGANIDGANETAAEEETQPDVSQDAGSTTVEPSNPPDAPAEGQEAASFNVHEATAPQNGAETDEHPSSMAKATVAEPTEEAHDEPPANNQDEHDDHVVEGEEDTVIY